jgi:hypothetical protein
LSRTHTDKSHTGSGRRDDPFPRRCLYSHYLRGSEEGAV